MVPEAPPDPQELQMLLECFVGDIAFDIGANVGGTARLLSRNFRQVIALEPAEESFEGLLLAAEECPEIVPLKLAASGVAGSLELAVHSDKINTGQLVTAAWPEWGSRTGMRTVQTTTVDLLVGRFGIPDLIKVDVEGHEGHVIQGAMTTIQDWLPGLYLEVHNSDLGAVLWATLSPYYPDLRKVEHPNYLADSWEIQNHYWLVAARAPRQTS